MLWITPVPSLCAAVCVARIPPYHLEGVHHVLAGVFPLICTLWPFVASYSVVADRQTNVVRLVVSPQPGLCVHFPQAGRLRDEFPQGSGKPVLDTPCASWRFSVGVGVRSLAFSTVWKGLWMKMKTPHR